MSDQHLVLDASALIELLLAGPLGMAVADRVDGAILHAPGHLDGEVLSGLGRLNRAGALTAGRVARHLGAIAAAPIERHPLAGLLAGAWRRRQHIRLADALYVELSAQLGVPLVTTDARLGRTERTAQVVGA